MGRNTQLNAYVGTLEELKDYVTKSRQLKVPEDSIYIYRTNVSDVFVWQKAKRSMPPAVQAGLGIQNWSLASKAHLQLATSEGKRV